jgi:hypothetical protein
VLQGLVTDEDPNVCVAAVEGITALGTEGAIEVVPVLASCLDADNELLRLAALDGLSALGVSLTYERLTRLAEDQALGHAVLAAAGRTGDERAAALLVRALPRARGGSLVGALRSIVEPPPYAPAGEVADASSFAQMDSYYDESYALPLGWGWGWGYAIPVGTRFGHGFRDARRFGYRRPPIVRGHDGRPRGRGERGQGGLPHGGRRDGAQTGAVQGAPAVVGSNRPPAGDPRHASPSRPTGGTVRLGRP